jgi:hypothetical protein
MSHDTRQEIAEAIRSQVQREVVARHPDFSYRSDNLKSEEPAADSKWFKSTISWRSKTQVSFGGTKNRFRHRGAVVLAISVPLNTGDEELTRFTDAITPYFQSDTIDFISWETPQLVRVGRARHWYQVNLVCPFYTDTLETTGGSV